MNELFMIIAFLIGMVFGGYLMGNKWAGNADRIQRHEYRGRLYKVIIDED